MMRGMPVYDCLAVHMVEEDGRLVRQELAISVPHLKAFVAQEGTGAERESYIQNIWARSSIWTF
jgi:hypothetical protein